MGADLSAACPAAHAARDQAQRRSRTERLSACKAGPFPGILNARSHRFSVTMYKKWFLILPALALVASILFLLPRPWDLDKDGSWDTPRHPLASDNGNPRIRPDANEASLNGVDQDRKGVDSLRGANVLFILVDALRPDFLKTYGYDGAGQNINELARKSLVYSTCIAQSSCTLPSVPSLFSSLLPSRIYPSMFESRTRHVSVSFPRHVRTLPDILKSHGYRTVGFVANPLMEARWGSNKGFTDYTFIERTCTDRESYGTATAITNSAIEWLNRNNDDAPYLMYLHYMDVHTKPCHLEYTHVKGGNRERNYYAQRVAYTDLEIGRILDEFRKRGLFDSAIILLTADHGEELGEHSGSRHCQTLFQETIQVPLILHAPLKATPQLITVPVRSLDITPTILQLLEIPFDDKVFDGVVLPPFNSEDSDRPLVSQRPRQMSFQEGHWKLIELYHADEANKKQYRGESTFLFNLENDPGERENLKDLKPELVARLKREIAEMMKGISPSREDDTLTEDMERALRALGYVE